MGYVIFQVVVPQAPQLKVVVLGHSFVSGLDQHFRAKYKGQPQALESHIALELKVDRNIASVTLLGQSGAKALNFEAPTYILDKIRPNIIILDLGSNDLAEGIVPEVVRDKIVAIAEGLQDAYSAAVGILSVLPREKGVSLGPAAFRQAFEAYNLSVKIATRNLTPIFFFSHKGFWEQQVTMGQAIFKLPMLLEAWSKDGIHPNSIEGRKKYKNSIRTAICQAIKLRKRHFSNN